MNEKIDTILLQPGDGPKYRLVGDTYTLKTTGAQTGGAYALFEFYVPPGGGPPPHTHHRETEVFLITEGRLTFELDGRTIDGPSGTLLQAPRGIRHRFVNAGASPARALVWVYPAGFENFLIEVADSVTDERGSDVSPIPAQIAKIIAAAPRYGLEIHAP